MHREGDLVMCLGDFNGHIGRNFDGVGLINFEGRLLLEFCLEKELCISNTWLRREEKRKVTFTMGENEKKIDIVLMKREH